MSDTEKKPAPKPASASTEKAAKPANQTLQDAFDEANEKGYFGTTPDKTPNEDYTVAGVTKGKK